MLHIFISETCFRIRTYFSQMQLNENGRWYSAEYDTFSIDSESNKYALRLSGFSGDAGDSLTNTSVNEGWYHGGMNFTTFDSDNDRSPINCAARNYQGGWWFNSCAYACLTGTYTNFHFRWDSLYHVTSYTRLRAARMMVKRNEDAETLCVALSHLVTVLICRDVSF